MSNGTEYNIPSIVNSQFQLDTDTYDKNGKINLSVFFAVGYGFSFATIAATITHVGLFYGKYGISTFFLPEKTLSTRTRFH
jgi:hypothetical protein